MVSGRGSIELDDSDIRFTYAVLRDGRNLQWPPGQFERRERAIQAVLVGRISEVWKEDEVRYGMSDPLFEKKNWNTIDSGFRLWGSGKEAVPNRNPKPKSRSSVSDRLLESKIWIDFERVEFGYQLHIYIPESFNLKDQ